MSNAKHARSLLYVILLWAGVGQLTAWGQQTDQAQSGTGATIRGRGMIVPTSYEEIRCNVGQPLMVLFMARPGAEVKKGDLLVELDAQALMDKSREQQLRVAKAEAALVMAQASLPDVRQEAAEAITIAEKALGLALQQLETYRTGEHPTQLIAATNDVRFAEEHAMMLQQRSAELEAAYKEQGAKSLERELLETRLAFTQAHVQAALAKDKLKLLKDMLHAQRTAELELVVAQKEFDLLRAKNKLTRVTRQGEADLRIAELAAEMEKDRLLLLEHQIKQSRLYAPRAGTVVAADDGFIGAPSEPEVRPGDTVHPRQVLLRLADLTQLQLDVRLSPPQARKLAPDHSAIIRCDAFPGRVFHGHVTGTQAPTDAEAADDRTGAIVTVRLDDPPKGFRPGMTATLEFEVSPAR